MKTTSARLLRLLSLLQTPRDWTGMELADRLEVSPRTVRNDIDRLRTLGYPVHATRGSVGGYRPGAEPYRIVNAGQRWYLVAWDLDRDGWRTFRVDRIKPGMSPGARFTPRDLTDDEVQDLISRGVPPEARTHQARVVVQAPAAQLT